MSKEKRTRTGSIGLATKLGAKFSGPAIKIFKMIKIGKITLAGASAASYALVFTWQFALVILALLVVHEYGHLWTMKRLNMKTKGIYLIPFLGAAAVADEDFPDRRTETVVAIAGPLTGAALAVLSGLAYLLTGNPYCAAVASWMALINLFNLLPVSPLDGGRVLKSVTFSIGTRLGLVTMVASLLCAAVLAVKAELFIFVVLIPLGIIDFLLERNKAKKDKKHRESFETALPELSDTVKLPASKPAMSARGVQLAFAGYVGLAVFLWMFMVLMAHEPGAAGAMHALQG